MARVRTEEDLGWGGSEDGIEDSGALDAAAFEIGGTGGLADDEFGMNGNEVRESGLPANALQQDAGGGGAHVRERLANCGEAGVVKCSALNIVKANDGNVGGNLEAVVHEGADGADGSNVVVAKERGEVDSALQELIGWLESELGRGDAEVEVHDEFRWDGELEIAGDGHKAVPAVVGVGAMAAAAHEGDFAVAKLVEMTQGKLGGALLIKDDVGDAFDFAVSRDNDGGESSETLFECCIDEDYAFNGAIHKEAWILFDEIGFAAVTCCEIEVAFFNEVLFNTAENLHGIAVTKFRDEDTDGERLALAQGARKETGAIVKFCGSFNDTIAGFLRDGADAGSVIQNQGNGGGREVEVLAQGAQADGLAGMRRRSWFSSLGHAFLF